jgi:hypothetical protein
MSRNLIQRLFGSRKSETPGAAAKTKRVKTLATINTSDTTSAKPRTRRTVGLTEQRLRARNEQSWLSSTKGWSRLFGRSTKPTKA